MDEDAGGKSIWESAALIYYLAVTKDPGHILLPEDALGAAQVLSWLSFQTSYMAKAHAQMFMPLYFGQPGEPAEVAAAVDQLRWCWGHLEAALVEGGGWLVGGRFTAADAGFAAAVATEAALLRESLSSLFHSLLPAVRRPAPSVAEPHRRPRLQLDTF